MGIVSPTFLFFPYVALCQNIGHNDRGRVSFVPTCSLSQVLLIHDCLPKSMGTRTRGLPTPSCYSCSTLKAYHYDFCFCLQPSFLLMVTLSGQLLYFGADTEKASGVFFPGLIDQKLRVQYWPGVLRWWRKCASVEWQLLPAGSSLYPRLIWLRSVSDSGF